MFPFQQALELKYGVGSEKVGVATKLIQSTINKVRNFFWFLKKKAVKIFFQVTKDLVGLYDGKILVQALVLEWNFP